MIALRFLLLAVLSFLLFRSPLRAQSDPVSCTDSAYCVPGVLGMPRPKGVILEYEGLTDFGIQARSRVDYLEDGAKREILENRRLLFKFRLPVYNSPGLKLIAGAEYFEEHYHFEEPQTLEYPLYRLLQQHTLRSVGTRLYISRLWRGNKYLFARLAANLNGDFQSGEVPLHRFLKVSASVLYGWKRNPQTAMGVGIGATYSFGRPLAFPLFMYNRSWLNGFGLEIMLPTKINARYNLSKSTIVYLTSELNGASYRIRLPESFSGEAQTFELRSSEVRNLFRVEQEIYDFLWLGLESGMRTNINFNLSEQNRIRRRADVVRNRLNHAFFFNVSLFLVPPRKWMKKK